MQNPLRVAKLVDVEFVSCVNAYSTRAAVCVALATVIITGGVGCFVLLPRLRRLQPVLAEEVVAVDHQIRKRDLRLQLSG